MPCALQLTITCVPASNPRRRTSSRSAEGIARPYRARISPSSDWSPARDLSAYLTLSCICYPSLNTLSALLQPGSVSGISVAPACGCNHAPRRHPPPLPVSDRLSHAYVHTLRSLVDQCTIHRNPPQHDSSELVPVPDGMCEYILTQPIGRLDILRIHRIVLMQ